MMHKWLHSPLYWFRDTCDVHGAVLILGVFALGLCAGCQTPAAPDAPKPQVLLDSKAANPQAAAQHRLLTERADKILIALSTRSYADLPSLCGYDPGAITGYYIAERIIGPNVQTAILELWDAQQMAVEFNPDLTQAVVNVILTYRVKPNHNPARINLPLSFHRDQPDRPWSLVLP